ncbi:SRPBCC family protein [Bradyrhizobium diazoefficiens]|nr:SRPBCC family protein [Bradyrhizobium diazoefficiens]MBR0702169.1 SRPBCC family protein [Bradyrhizobium diazoefficiens]MBR0770924.1 SRPBCC family protein [Bradyrhizobium diazoefficiens]
MNKPEFVYVTYIETTPEKLWEALTSSAFTRQYWFDTEVRSDWKVGSPFALVMGGKVTDTGEILEADRPRRLSYTFKHELMEEMRNEAATKVVFTLAPFGNLVKLTVTHEGFAAGSKLLDGISKGWPAILSGLKSLLETGKAPTIPPAALGIEGFAR